MDILKVVFVIIGSIIGAGFASGKEIYEYFAKFGGVSLIYSIPLFLLFFVIIKTYLKFGSNFTNINLKCCNNSICHCVKIKNLKINYINVFMFTTFLILCSAMYSGLFSLFKTYFPNIDRGALFILIFMLSYLISRGSLKSLNVISFAIVPLMIVCIFVNTGASFTLESFSFFNGGSFMQLPILCGLYVCQNTFLASFVLIKNGQGLSNKKQNTIAFLTSLILTLLIVVGVLCLLSCPSSASEEMPFAICASNISPVMGALYGIIIFCAIITTYFTTLNSLKEYFKGDKKYNKQFLMILLVALFSLFNFGVIVEYLYPVIGIFGAVYFCILWKNRNVNFSFYA